MNPSTTLIQTLRRLSLAPLGAILAASLAWGQVAQTAAPRAEPAAKSAPRLVPTTAPAEDATSSGEIIELSPFEVVTDNKGYYASNSMSGTRFNTKVEDLASSLTVVTKEQMTDFAMLDVNDIFLYTASTEGTGTYTDYTIDRNGSVFENVSTNPTGANRVRGIASANISLGNIETMGRVPVDPLAVDSIEVSRGPNSNVSGLGNPSGTVNMVPASANLSRNRAQATVRADNFGGYRATVDVNRVLLRNRLALRASWSDQHDGFVRKPSGADTVRYNFMGKWQPFKWTTVSASYSHYRLDARRPNASPPRDSLSYWLDSGKPTWDPVRQVIHVGTQTLGPFTSATGMPDYFTNTFTGSGRSYVYVDGGAVAYWTTANTNNLTPSSGSATPAANGQSIRFLSPTPAAGSAAGKITAQPLFTTTPSVRSKAIYDWTSINLNSINRQFDYSETSSVQFDQVFFNTPRQTLVAQASWLRENSHRYQRNIMSQGDNGQNGQLLIDVNERLLDGSPNPFFLRPYIGVDQPRTVTNPSRWDTYRAQVAYKLDLTREPGALKWLGWHQVTGYAEYKYRLTRRYSFKDAMTSDHPWIVPAGISRANQGAISGGPAAALNITRGYFRYYVGDNAGSNIDYAPTEFRYGTFPFVWGGYTVSSNLPTNAGTFFRENVSLGQVAVTDSTGAGSNSQTIIRTQGAVVQSHFLNERIVTTFGVREDKQFVKNGTAPQLLNADGMTFNYESIDHWAAGDYKFNSGKTKTSGVVVRPFREIPALTRAAEEGAGWNRFFAGAARGLALTYNKSDSFTPQDPRVDVFLNPLPNPSGEGKDYGFWLNLLDNRLVIRVNRWENSQLKARGGDAGTIAQRVTRIDLSSTANYLLLTQATNWVREANPAWTDAQVQTEVARQIGVSTDLQNRIIAAFNAGQISATQDITAKGTEIEINFNPTRYWTVSASVTETRSINSNVSRAVNDWIAQRMPIWTTIKDPRGPDHVTGTADDRPVNWWTENYGGSQTAAQNYASFVETPYLVIQQQEGKSNPQIRRYAARASTNLQLGAISDNAIVKRFSVGGALRWEDKGAIGYYGLQQLPAVITALDPNRPVYDKSHLYLDAFVSYRTRLFADRIPVTFRLNVRNLQEDGRLQPIGAYPDGTPTAYRIVDPRQFILQASFDL